MASFMDSIDTSDLPKICDYCQEDSVVLFKCSKCKDRKYCSKDCQKMDFKEHKQVCIEKACGECHKSSDDVKLSKCSKCHRIYYCSRSCQLANYKKHQRDCKPKNSVQMVELNKHIFTMNQENIKAMLNKNPKLIGKNFYYKGGKWRTVFMLLVQTELKDDVEFMKEIIEKYKPDLYNGMQLAISFQSFPIFEAQKQVIKAVKGNEWYLKNIINKLSSSRESLLYQACKKRNASKIVEDIIGDCDPADLQSTIIQFFNYIISNDRKDILEALLLHGNKFDVNTTDVNGHNALHIACTARIPEASRERKEEEIHADRTELIKMLIDNGANVNASDKKGDTVMHRVLYTKKPNFIIKLLVEAGARIDLPNHDGNTAVHYMARYGRMQKAIDMITDDNATIELFEMKNNRGETAIPLAHDGLVKLTLEAKYEDLIKKRDNPEKAKEDEAKKAAALKAQADKKAKAEADNKAKAETDKAEADKAEADKAVPKESQSKQQEVTEAEEAPQDA